MGAACASGMTVFSQGAKEKTVKVLIIGKPLTGKTFLLYSWKYGVDSILSVEPTSHFNVDTVTTNTGMKILVYDLAGNIGLRMRPFLGGTNGVVYNLGLQSRDDFLNEEEVLSLQLLLQERDLDNVPFLFVLRQDVNMSECQQDLPDKLQQSLKNRAWDLVQMQSSSQEGANMVLKILEKLLTDTSSLES